jgi:hypothetical protein
MASFGFHPVAWIFFVSRKMKGLSPIQPRFLPFRAPRRRTGSDWRIPAPRREAQGRQAFKVLLKPDAYVHERQD